MAATNVAIDDALIALLGPSGEDVPGAVREALTLELGRSGAVSGGRAAMMILGLAAREFVRGSGGLGLPSVRHAPGELARELETLSGQIRLARPLIDERTWAGLRISAAAHAEALA